MDCQVGSGRDSAKIVDLSGGTGGKWILKCGGRMLNLKDQKAKCPGRMGPHPARTLRMDSDQTEREGKRGFYTKPQLSSNGWSGKVQ